MSTMNSVSSVLDVVVGLHVLSAERGHGSFLTITLSGGMDKPETHRLWVYLCDWVLRENAHVLVCSDTISEANAAVVSLLVGRKITKYAIGDDNDWIELFFDGNMSLQLDEASDLYGEEAEMLLFFELNKHKGSFLHSTGVKERT